MFWSIINLPELFFWNLFIYWIKDCLKHFINYVQNFMWIFCLCSPFFYFVLEQLDILTYNIHKFHILLWIRHLDFQLLSNLRNCSHIFPFYFADHVALHHVLNLNFILLHQIRKLCTFFANSIRRKGLLTFLSKRNVWEITCTHLVWNLCREPSKEQRSLK